jgi:hypothetical protein
VTVIYRDEFSVDGTTVTHIPSGAWWTFNFNSPNPYRSDTRRLGKSLTIADAAKDIWALHLRTMQSATRVLNSFSGQATL